MDVNSLLIVVNLFIIISQISGALFIMYRLFCLRTKDNFVRLNNSGTVFALIFMDSNYCTYKITTIFVLNTIL